MSEKPADKKFLTVEVTVRNVQPGQKLRLSECGATPLGNGAVFMVPIDVGIGLVERHANNLHIEGKKAHNTPSKEVSALKSGHYEILNAGEDKPAEKKKPVDTSKAPAMTKQGEATNKSMADRATTKA